MEVTTEQGKNLVIFKWDDAGNPATPAEPPYGTEDLI